MILEFPKTPAPEYPLVGFVSNPEDDTAGTLFILEETARTLCERELDNIILTLAAEHPSEAIYIWHDDRPLDGMPGGLVVRPQMRRQGALIEAGVFGGMLGVFGHDCRRRRVVRAGTVTVTSMQKRPGPTSTTSAGRN